MDKRLVRFRHYQRLCQLHFKRLSDALDSLKILIPLNTEKYKSLTKADLAVIDQVSYRFTKLQDTGGQLIKAILILIGEDIQALPFIDVLNKAERLGVIESADEWLLLREQRNFLSHEYSVDEAEVVEGINKSYELSKRLCEIYSGIEEYCRKRRL